MVSIRLSRVGRRNSPSYRVIVVPKHKDPWGDVIEILGHFNPLKNPKELVIDAERVKYWIGQGAEPSDTVWNLLVDEKIVTGKKHNVTHISDTRHVTLNEAKKKAEPAPAAEAPAA